MEEKLVQRLLATVSLDAFYNDRIYWQSIPTQPASLPALTLSIAADPVEYNHDARDDLQEVRIQFDSRALSYGDAKKGLRAVLFEMEQQRVVDGVTFHEGRKVSGSDAPKETWAGGTQVFRITMDVLVQFRITG